MEHILQGLNPKQVEAVRAIQGPVLVISGPGSGKTRCLTHRIAYLIASGVRPEQILAVTFTNKAANEIKERVERLLGEGEHAWNRGRPVLGTFHSVGLRILRKEIPLLGYGSNFTILDTNDQTALVKRVIAGLELDVKKFNPSTMLGKISKLKTELIFPEHHHPHEFYEQIVAKVYARYQAELKQLNALDFDDLIVLPVKIFRQHPTVLEKYQNFWQYILVDEYQDTSHDQYMFVTMLAAGHKNLFCIGDDAQSIYMFREADIRNILNFQKDYPDGKVILLEQNYRSTKTILSAAQGIISNNKAQIPKELWTENGEGDKITVKEALNERDEARFVIETMQGLIKKGYTTKDFTVLYRTHAQSRAIEEALITSGFPYQIVGGIKFYERREIKDILAYVRFLYNPTDFVSFERIANVPSRGIGKSTLEKILAKEQPDLMASLLALAQDNPKTKTGKSFADFHATLTDLRQAMSEHTLSQWMKQIVKKVGYEEHLINLQGDAFENAEERIENLKELFTVAKTYDQFGADGVGKFLEEVALLQETDKLKASANAITLMTVHSSKGLEFPVVFIIGMEEGLFPHSRSIFEPHELEEERRLCYVAITRAKERLYATFTKYRHIFGSTQANLPSRFIGEMPQHALAYQWFDSYGDEEETIDY